MFQKTARAFLGVLADYCDVEQQSVFETRDRAIGDRIREALWEITGGCSASIEELERRDREQQS